MSPTLDRHARYEELLEVIKGRRSVRSFLPKPVPWEMIQKVMEAARWAPSSCNKQGWKFFVLDDPILKAQLAERVDNPETHHLMKEVPVLLYVLYDKTVSPDKSADIQSAAAAIQNLMLAAHSLGLATSWYAQFHDRLIREHFQVPERYHFVATVLIGYPREIPPPSYRMEMDRVIVRNRFEDTEGYRSSPKPEAWTLKQISEFISCNIFATSPEIGFVYSRPWELSALLSFLNQRLNGHERLLFLFTVPGELPLYFASCWQGPPVTCAEPSLEGLQWMKKRQAVLGISEERVTYHLLEDPWDDGTFDAVILFETLNRVGPKERRELLKRGRQVLSEKGRLFVFNANRFSYHGLALRKNDYCFLMHLGPFEFLAASSIRRLLSEAGLVPLRFIGINPLPSWEVLARNCPVGRLRERMRRWKGRNLEGYCTSGPLKSISRMQCFECRQERSGA